MRFTSWIRRHPIATSLIAFLLLAGAAAGSLALYVLSDQRRSAQLLSSMLREALGLEIRIERVVQAGPDRLVLKGVSFPGVPLDLRVPEIRVEGRLLSLLTQRSGRLTLTVVAPTLSLPASSTVGPPLILPLGLPAETLVKLRETARQFLEAPVGLTIQMADGVLRRGEESLPFALQVRKEEKAPEAAMDLELRGGGVGATPLSLSVSLAATDDVVVARIRAEGSAGLLLSPTPEPIRTTPETRLEADTLLRLPRAPAIEVSGRLVLSPVNLGDLHSRAMRIETEGTYLPDGERLEIRRLTVAAGPEVHLVADGTVVGSRRPEIVARIRQSRLHGPLVQRIFSGAPSITGIIEIPELSLAVRLDGPGPVVLSRVQGRLRIPALSAAPTYPVGGARLDLDLVLEREARDGTTVARGLLRAESLTAGPLTMEGVTLPYLVRLDSAGSIVLAESRPLTARLWGDPVTVTAAFNRRSGTVSARIEARSADLSRWATGAGLKNLPWNPRAPMRLSGLTAVVTAALDPGAPGAIRDAALGLEGGPLDHRLGATAAPLRIARVRAKVDVGASDGKPLRRMTGAFALAGVRGIPGVQGELAEISGRIALRGDVINGPEPLQLADGLMEIRDDARRLLLRLVAGPVAGRPAASSLAVELPDLALLRGYLLGPDERVEGKASGTFRVWRALAPEPWGYEGQVSLRVSRGEFLGGSVRVQNLGAELPVKGNAGAAGESGAVTADAVSLYGLELRSLRSPVRLFGGLLSLSDLRYDLYGGRGSGWVEAALGSGPVSLRSRLEGEKVDIDRVFREYPIQGGMMTGRLSYTVGFRHMASQGSEVGGTIQVKEPGGTVSISVLRRLLSYADTDPTGILRQTLENLSEFRYRTLDVDVRTVGGTTRLNLKLVGKGGLFGLLPPRVREINIKNVPLDFLVRTFSQR